MGPQSQPGLPILTERYPWVPLMSENFSKELTEWPAATANRARRIHHKDTKHTKKTKGVSILDSQHHSKTRHKIIEYKIIKAKKKFSLLAPNSSLVPHDFVLSLENLMIEVTGLCKSFRDASGRPIPAVDGVSFSARPGEILGLLGPNGAGKTTALRILCTLLKPTSGKASVAGFDVVTQADEVRRHVGFLSANTGVYDRMTAYEMVLYYGRLSGLPEEKLAGRIAELFDVLAMNDIRDVRGSKMSTGQKQKVSIARALVHDPPVLIFDEPTNGLDVLVQRSVLQQVQALRDRGKCILYSTHIFREVEKICDRVAIIHRGKVLDAGTLDELRERHHEQDLEELFFGMIEGKGE